jgi:hypothetical protein
MLNFEMKAYFYLGIEYLLVRTEFFAIDSCNSGKENPLKWFLHGTIHIFYECAYNVHIWGDIDTI